MTYETALELAKNVIKDNPDYILCGSVALILAGVIPTREVNDLDFIALKSNLSEEKLQLINYPGLVLKEKTGYKTYKQELPTVDFSKGWYYNLFIHDIPEIKTQVVNGVVIQDVDTILKFKKLYSRTKDVADLENVRG